MINQLISQPEHIILNNVYVLYILLIFPSTYESQFERKNDINLGTNDFFFYYLSHLSISTIIDEYNPCKTKLNDINQISKMFRYKMF